MLRRLFPIACAALVPLLLVVASPSQTRPRAIAATTTAANTVLPLLDFVPDHASGQVWSAYSRSYIADGPAFVGSASPVTVGNGPGHVYVHTLSGDLVEYVNDNGGGRAWNAYDLSIASGSGVQLIGNPSAVVDVGQALVHVYVHSANGDLIEFLADHAQGRVWNAYDLSTAAGGGAPVGGVANAVYDAGQHLVHVYVPGSNGHLIEYLSDHANGHIWNAYDLTTAAGGGTPTGGDPSAVYDPGQGLVHVYVASNAGHLVEYLSDHADGHIWNAYDLTAVAGGGQPITGSADGVYIGGLVHVYTRSPGNHLVEFVSDHASGHIWNAYDLSGVAGGGGAIAGTPSGVALAVGVVHIYAQTPGNDLIEYVSDHAGGHVWNAYDVTSSSQTATIGADPVASVFSDGLIHVFAGGPLSPVGRRAPASGSTGSRRGPPPPPPSPKGGPSWATPAAWARAVPPMPRSWPPTPT